MIRASCGGDQRDRADADEQPALERSRGQLHGRVGRGGGHVEVEHGLLAVRRADVDELAGRELVDVAADLLDGADELVAERRRVHGPRRVGPHERAQVAVEDAVGEGRGAAVEAQLGAVADAADAAP